ncbi:MAG: COR domain-containing protein [Saprospiraceae bacterium]
MEVETYKCSLQMEHGSQKMQYYLWDFGGQDYYRLLHQLFVSEQAVYVIVTDTDRNKNEEEIDFWLETIQRLGKDKNGKYGPVILLQNPKTDREGSSFPDLKKRYQELWRQSEDFVINLDKIASNKPGFDKSELSRFKHFKDFLEKSFHQLDHLGQEMPRQWVRIRKKLAKLTTEHYGISRDQFRTVCEKENIKNHEEQNDLLKIFNILGFLLHYDTGSLSNMVILNKEWATDALYRVLDDETVKTNKGWFLKKDASQIWNDFKYKDRENELLQLMQEFKLSYHNETSGKYIVPSKLPEDTEWLPEWDTTGNVRLHLRYDWLPRPIATQLIILCNCKDCAKVPKPFEFEYEQVLRALKMAKQLQCNNSFESFTADKVLNRVFDDTTVLIDTMVKGERSELLKLISMGEIEQVFEQLGDSHVTVGLKAQYSQLLKNEIAGVISDSARMRTRNQITKSLIMYLSEKTESPSHFPHLLKYRTKT